MASSFKYGAAAIGWLVLSLFCVAKVFSFSENFGYHVRATSPAIQTAIIIMVVLGELALCLWRFNKTDDYKIIGVPLFFIIIEILLIYTGIAATIILWWDELSSGISQMVYYYFLLNLLMVFAASPLLAWGLYRIRKPAPHK
jgi:hypothetical protein